ncbi:MAG: hypothetical protein ACM3ZC_10520 [Bacteroidota bacterium]
MALESRFLAGVVAGVIAGMAKDLSDLVSFYLFRLSTTRFLDFSAFLIFGHKPRTIVETTFAIAAQIGWSAALAVFFCFLVPLIGRRNYLLKSTFFGVAAWFTIYAVLALHKVHGLYGFSLSSCVSNIFGAILFGLVLGLVSQRLLPCDRASI